MISVEEAIEECIKIATEESFKAPLSVDHPWDRGYRAGAAAVAMKIRDKLKEPK